MTGQNISISVLFVMWFSGYISAIFCSVMFHTKYNETWRNLEEISPKRDIKRTSAKNERMRKFVQKLMSFSPPENFKADPGVPNHNPKGPAIFAAAMSVDFQRNESRMFVQTARNAGYQGDIVLALLPKSLDELLMDIKEANCITYTVSPDCQGEENDMVCSFPGHDVKVSINMVRFFIYQWWSRLYESDALIMLSDFRDVFFQANPFTYRTFEWAPPVSQLVVFQEAYPNKVIYRCIFNSGWIENCYGSKGLRRVGSNTVSCSGVTIGTRNAIAIYVSANLANRSYR
jgi:hypothetical protein